jgi:integrase
MKGHTRKRLDKEGRVASWAYVIDIGRDAAGRRKQKWVSGFPTEKAADRAMRDALSQLDKGRNPFPSDQTVATYVGEWLVAHNVRPRTKHRYEQLLDGHILPTIGSRRLVDLTPAHLRVVWSAMLVKGCAPATVRQARAVLSAALNTAVADGVLDRNPAAAAKAPKVLRPTLTVVRPEHVKSLLRTAAGTRWEVALMLAAIGMRRSEVLGLAWENVDLDRATLRVVRGLHVIPGPRTPDHWCEFQEPKSDRGKRTIRLPATLVEQLRRHRLAQMQRRVATPEWHDLGLVVEDGDGSPVHPDTFSLAFKSLAKRAGLPSGARLHDLRHACVVKMRLDGVPIVAVAEHVGHSSPGFTLSVYEHVVTEMQDAAVNALESLLGG